MKYVKITVLLMIFLALSFSFVSMAKETEDNRDNYCTIEDFCNHQIYAFYQYRTFFCDGEGTLDNLLHESYWITYNTNKRTATGKILVFGQEGEGISALLKNGEERFLAEGYYGKNRPGGLTFTYMAVDDIEVSAFSDYDIVILEESVRDDVISNDTFLAMEDYVKEVKYLLFAQDMLFPCHSDKTTGAVFSYNPETEELLMGKDCPWPGVLYDSDGEAVNIPKEEISSVKILPTYEQDSIKRERFQGFTNLQEVKYPAHITTVGADAFADCGLTDFDFTGISGIGSGAFKNCRLQELTLDEGLEVIASEAFFGNPITKLEVGPALTEIGNLAFAQTEITDVSIPCQVKKIGDRAFAKTKLRTVTIHSDGTRLGESAFADNTALEKLSIHIGDGGIRMGKNCFQCVPEKASLQLVYGDGMPTKTQMFDLFEDNACEVNMHSLIALTNNGERNITYIGEREDSYLLSFNPDGGEMEKPSSILVNNGETYRELPVPQRGGYVFSGWFTEKGTEIKEGDIIELAENAVLIARWKKLGEAGVYTVTFWNTINNSVYTKKEVKNGDTWDKYLLMLKDYKFNTYKLVFKGWAFDNGTIIKGTDIVALNRDITVYAEYTKKGEAKVYTVSFPEYNKKIRMQIGDMFADYDIPKPSRKGDVFLGWALATPVADKSEIVYTSLKHVRFMDIEKRTLFAVWRSTIKNHNLTTKETLPMTPLYYLGKNNMGKIVNGDDEREYALNVTQYTEQDEKNADWLLGEILSCKAGNGMVMILPEDYKINTKNYKKYGIIRTGWDLETYITALSLMDCKYFHYLRMIQTPYFNEESQFDMNKGWDKELGYVLYVSDFEIPQHNAGIAYTVKQKTFSTYYRICKRVDDQVSRICRENFDRSTTVTDAMKRINEITLADYAYDCKYQIYDLNWFLKVTSKSRNRDKKVDHHGVCASYSKFAFAVMAKCGIEAMPCADDGHGHSFNKIMIDGSPYYCDYTWADAAAPARYMFLDLNAMNFADNHHNPIPDNYGWRVTVSHKKGDKQLEAVAVKKAENVKGRRVILKYGKNKCARGYEIQYSTDRKFKKAKMVTTKKNTVTLKKLKKGKTYYVRVRPYKTIALNRIISDTGVENDWVLSTAKKSYRSYGKWSKASKVKIKK